MKTRFLAVLLVSAYLALPASAEILETAAGMRVSKSPTQKLGFHGATPTVQRSGSAQAALPVLTAATGLLTFTAQPANNETVTIGATTYTFKTTLSTGPTVANEILRGADAAASVANLIGAINAASSGGQSAGTTYGTGTTANASVTAAAGAGTSVALTAKTAGVAGNSVATTETSTVGSFANATLTGGVDAATIAQITVLVNELRAASVQKGLIKGGP